MTFPEFDKFQEELLKEVVKMKDTKGKEYANSESRFANFDRGAEKNGVSRLVVANIYLTKHMDAIDSYIKSHGQVFSTENIRGRLVDAITYLTLIAGMAQENESYKLDDLKVMGVVDENIGKHQPFEYDPTVIWHCYYCHVNRSEKLLGLLCPQTNNSVAHIWVEKNAPLPL